MIIILSLLAVLYHTAENEYSTSTRRINRKNFAHLEIIYGAAFETLIELPRILVSLEMRFCPNIPDLWQALLAFVAVLDNPRQMFSFRLNGNTTCCDLVG
jgi:hypothetical protein